MGDLKSLEDQFSRRLGLKRRPVAVMLLQEEPAQIRKFTGTEPSGCSFWRLAAEGKTFYTVPSDHYNCPVGAYTHNIDLPAERAQELNGVLGMMFGAERDALLLRGRLRSEDNYSQRVAIGSSTT